MTAEPTTTKLREERPEPGRQPRELPLDRGVFLVSIDTEMAWGSAHRRQGSRFDGPETEPVRFTPEDAAHERRVIDQVLDIFARYEIPGTWAMVGHLFLEGCDRGDDGRPHPDRPRPDYEWLDGDWFDVDPCSDVANAPEHYAPDVVRRIAACPVPQEIASHGFTHMVADDPGCGAEVFAGELAASQAAAASHGVELRSFVYPRNAIAHVEQLSKAGFTSYRGRGSGERAVPVHEDPGIWNLPQTHYFAPGTRRRRLPAALWVRPALRRLGQAVGRRSLFHLWFHPADVTVAPARALDCLDRICRAAAAQRDRGRLDTLTMAQLTERLEVAGRDGVGCA